MAANAADTAHLAKEAAEGIFGIADYVPGASEATRKYAADYLKEYNEEFDPTSAWTYDGLNILVNAIKKGGEDRAKIREALLATQGLHGRPGYLLFHPER